MSGSIRITDPAAGQDLRRQQHGAADRNGAAPGHGPLDLNRVTVLDGQGRRSSVDRAGGGQHGQVGGGQVGADRLDPDAADHQVDHLDARPEPDRLAGPDRAEPELPAGHGHVPRGWDDPVELDRSTRPG